jgi:hypothetical protein
VYVGPGMSSSVHKGRTSMLPRSSTVGTLSSLNGTGLSGFQASTRQIPDDSMKIDELTSDGKRRRTDDGHVGITSSTSVPNLPSQASTSNLITSTSSKPPAANTSSSQIPRSAFHRTGPSNTSSANPVHPSPLRTMTKLGR